MSSSPSAAARGILIAAPGSGSGKTSVTLGLLRALARRGRKVGGFKVGPDYIDPGLHAAACGEASPNLDSWAMRLSTLADLCARLGRADVVVGEGVMGLFDGGLGGAGSTADVAAILDLPVVLVVDAGGMAQSAAAVVEGFIRFRNDVDVAGVIFNRIGGPAHAEILRRACDDRFSQPVLGCLPCRADLELPSRHLGLVPAGEVDRLEPVLDRLAEAVDAHLDLDRLVRLGRPFGLTGIESGPPVPPLGQRIALACDDAFVFAYPWLLAHWRRAGAEILPFSPLDDQAPDPAADAVFLPGGYPELHAGRLAAAGRFGNGVREAAARGAFVYGECGGYMVLGRALTDADGITHPLLDLLPVETSFAERRLHLGYRRVLLRETLPLGPRRARFRGHEFHFASVRAEAVDGTLFDLSDARERRLGAAGLIRGRVAGSFVHLIDRES